MLTSVECGELLRRGEMHVERLDDPEVDDRPELAVYCRCCAELVDHRARSAGRNLALVRADELVFTTGRSKPQSRRNALRAVSTAAAAAGLHSEELEPVGLHDLRHSLVAIAFELGSPRRRSRCSPGTLTRRSRSPCTPA